MLQLFDMPNAHSADTHGGRSDYPLSCACRAIAPTSHILMGDRSESSVAGRAATKKHLKPLESFHLTHRPSLIAHGLDSNIPSPTE